MPRPTPDHVKHRVVAEIYRNTTPIESRRLFTCLVLWRGP